MVNALKLWWYRRRYPEFCFAHGVRKHPYGHWDGGTFYICNACTKDETAQVLLKEAAHTDFLRKKHLELSGK